MTTMKMFGLMLLLAGVIGCDDKPAPMAGDMASAGDLGTTPANFDVDMQCFDNPMRHDELINSCASGVERIDKNPTLPLLNPDGTRPPLP